MNLWIMNAINIAKNISNKLEYYTKLQNILKYILIINNIRYAFFYTIAYLKCRLKSHRVDVKIWV